MASVSIQFHPSAPATYCTRYTQRSVVGTGSCLWPFHSAKEKHEEVILVVVELEPEVVFDSESVFSVQLGPVLLPDARVEVVEEGLGVEEGRVEILGLGPGLSLPLDFVKVELDVRGSAFGLDVIGFLLGCRSSSILPPDHPASLEREVVRPLSISSS